MQYVRNLSDSVSTAWNSINPATLSGAIDVIVVEQDDGTLACSPFHVRFGKFSLLRPYEKKVEFKVNGAKQDYAMKLGEGGEAFFVFETTDTIPQSLQTSPLVSPASSPPLNPEQPNASDLQEPEQFDLDGESGARSRTPSLVRPPPTVIHSNTAPGDAGFSSSLATSPDIRSGFSKSGDWSTAELRPYSDDILRRSARRRSSEHELEEEVPDGERARMSDRSHSPPPLAPREAIERAMVLSRELSANNIPTHVTETGDLMLDMTGFKSNEEDAIRAEMMARNILSEELEGNYDIGALFGVDEHGNLWIYSSEEAKDAAMKRTMESIPSPAPALSIDAASDPGYHSDGSDGTASHSVPYHRRAESDVGQMQTPPTTPGSSRSARPGGDPNRNYAKTLRLTSDQLKALDLQPGHNSMSFTVNRATCQAYMYLWKYDTPVVISDIDGTITKSDALGHVLNMIGRDWTHAGVAKLYSDICANGYNIMYLTSRSVGQADTTRAYLNGIVQERYRLPPGPTILSPDRTMAALRREIYLRKPHIFKMSTLRDIRSLYGPEGTPFYAGFGNRLTDQISYRTVDVPRNRIFTINSNAEVSLDLLSLNKLKLSYVNMTEVVDHYFPPVSTLVKGGGEEYTDFKYWRDTPLDLDEFSASESDEQEDNGNDSAYAEEEDDDDDEVGEGMMDSYISRGSVDESILSGSIAGDERMMDSIMADEEDADDEDEEEEEEEEEEDEDGHEKEDEDEGADRSEEEDKAEKDVEDGEGATLKIPRVRKGEQKEETASAARKALSPKIAVQDLTAEIITGVQHLAVERDGVIKE